MLTSLGALINRSISNYTDAQARRQPAARPILDPRGRPVRDRGRPARIDRGNFRRPDRVDNRQSNRRIERSCPGRGVGALAASGSCG